MKKKERGSTAIILTVIIAVLAIGGGIYYWHKNHPVSPQPISTADTGWKTYTSSAFGVEVQYPPDWQVSTPGSYSGNFLLGPNANTTIVSFETSKSFHASTDIPVVIGGRSGNRQSNSQDGTVISIPLENGNTLLISGPYNGGYVSDFDKIFEKIVASVKFI